VSRRVTQSTDEEEATDVWERLSETRRTDTTQVCLAPSTVQSAKSLSRLVLPRCCLSVTLLSHSYVSLIVGLSLLSILESVKSLSDYFCCDIVCQWLYCQMWWYFSKDKIILENRINFWFTFFLSSKIILFIFRYCSEQYLHFILICQNETILFCSPEIINVFGKNCSHPEDGFEMKWKCSDLECVRKPTRSRLSLSHHANISSRWAE